MLQLYRLSVEVDKPNRVIGSCSLPLTHLLRPPKLPRGLFLLVPLELSFYRVVDGRVSNNETAERHFFHCHSSSFSRCHSSAIDDMSREVPITARTEAGKKGFERRTDEDDDLSASSASPLALRRHGRHPSLISTACQITASQRSSTRSFLETQTEILLASGNLPQSPQIPQSV